MKDLNESRKKINEIDTEMARLFVDRMNISKDIAEYKKENSIPIADANREQALLENNLKLIEDETLKSYYVNFMKTIMNISKEYQQSLLTNLK